MAERPKSRLDWRKELRRGRHEVCYTRIANSDGYPKGCFGSSPSQKAIKKRQQEGKNA